MERMQHTRKDCAVTDQRQHLKMKLIIVLSVLCVLVNCRPQFQFPGISIRGSNSNAHSESFGGGYFGGGQFSESNANSESFSVNIGGGGIGGYGGGPGYFGDGFYGNADYYDY